MQCPFIQNHLRNIDSFIEQIEHAETHFQFLRANQRVVMMIFEVKIDKVSLVKERNLHPVNRNFRVERFRKNVSGLPREKSLHTGIADGYKECERKRNEYEKNIKRPSEN